MKKSDKPYTSINIETLILVAVWTSPFIFQGTFKIFDKDNANEHLVFYRCECNKSDKTDILEDEFSSFDYQFTHLYTDTIQFQENLLNELSENAIYLLQYALYVALTKMITNNKQNCIYIDEIALLSLTKRIKQVFNERKDLEVEEEIGFAVAMDFNPQEHTGLEAVRNLLSILRSE